MKNTPNPSASGIAADVSGGKNLKKEEESAKEKIVNSKDIAETVVKWVKPVMGKVTVIKLLRYVTSYFFN